MLQYKNYAIKFPNGKHYIGFTKKTPKQRYNEHCKKADKNPTSAIHFAIKKYGKETLEIIYLNSFDSMHDALQNEIKLIKEYQSHITENGYNCTRGADNVPANFGGDYWRQGKTAEQLAIINKKKARPGEKNSFYKKKHTKENLAKAVATRREKGSYNPERMASSNKVEYNGVIYFSQQELRRITKLGRPAMERMIQSGQIKVLIKRKRDGTTSS